MRLLFCLGLLVFASVLSSGCLWDPYGDFEDPYVFSGRLDQGNPREQVEQISQALRQSSNVITISGGSYKVGVDGQQACQDGRERVLELAFIRSAGPCERP
jgi:hypothetical protein